VNSQRNYGCRLRDFVWRGYRCITLENEILRVLVAADKGADILEFLHKPTDTECLWSSPAGLQSQQFRPSCPLETGHFREYFAGGWYEMLPNGPAPCEHRGAKFGYHGEATLLAWDVAILDDEPEQIAVRFSARLNRVPLHVEKTMRLHAGGGSLVIEERIRNVSRQQVELLWGQHPTFGAPLLEPGTRVYLPKCEAVVAETVPPDARLAPGQRSSWPNLRSTDGELIDLSVIPTHDSASHDFIRLEKLDAGCFAVVNPHRRVGFALGFDHKLFPVLGYWRLFNGGPDYPWYGQHFLAALEPACDLPSLSDAAARGTAIVLDGGAAVSTTFEATVFSGVEPGGIVS
jgi:hypothetical protein